MSEAPCDVLILGAGMAGLTAARTLAESGRRVLVLEASDRIGGRIRTLRRHGEVIELGAEFIHGRPPELWALIEEAGLATYERTGDFLVLEDGKLCVHEEDREDVLGGLEHYDGPDQPFREYLQTLGLPDWQQESALGYVEGFNAADASEASILALAKQQRAEDQIEGDRTWRLTDGYDHLPAFLQERAEAAGAKLVFAARIVSVTWRPGAVVMIDHAGRTFQAPQALITAPLGVLRSGALAIEPMPEMLNRPGLCMGDVCRFTLVFNQQLWPDNLSFLLTPGSLPSVWWTANPAASLTLTGWVGGPKCLPLLAMSEAELRELAIQSVAAAFAIGETLVASALIDFVTLNWTAAETACGAYSWVQTDGLPDSAALAEPVQQTLFFAGEHTDTTGHWGTVHAAYRSGLRAAAQIVGACVSRTA